MNSKIVVLRPQDLSFWLQGPRQPKYVQNLSIFGARLYYFRLCKIIFSGALRKDPRVSRPRFSNKILGIWDRIPHSRFSWDQVGSIRVEGRPRSSLVGSMVDLGRVESMVEVDFFSGRPRSRSVKF